MTESRNLYCQFESNEEIFHEGFFRLTDIPAPWPSTQPNEEACVYPNDFAVSECVRSYVESNPNKEIAWPISVLTKDKDSPFHLEEEITRWSVNLIGNRYIATRIERDPDKSFQIKF